MFTDMFFLLCMHTTCKHVIPICIPVSHKCISSPSPSRARAKRSPPEVWASGFCGRFANNKTPRRTAWGCHVRQENSHFFGDSLQHAGVQLSDLTNGDMSYLSIHPCIDLPNSVHICFGKIATHVKYSLCNGCIASLYMSWWLPHWRCEKITLEK